MVWFFSGGELYPRRNAEKVISTATKINAQKMIRSVRKQT
jgi:hypothetical protein